VKAQTVIVIAAGVAGLVAAIYLLKKGKDAAAAVKTAAGKVANAVNPLSDTNLAYSAANAVTQSLTGDAGTSFGSWLYDVTHPNAVKANAPATRPTPARSSIDLGTYANTAADDDQAIGSFARFGGSMFDPLGNTDRHDPLTIEIVGSGNS
jgi:hypothetical protein